MGERAVSLRSGGRTDDPSSLFSLPIQGVLIRRARRPLWSGRSGILTELDLYSRVVDQDRVATRASRSDLRDRIHRIRPCRNMLRFRKGSSRAHERSRSPTHASFTIVVPVRDHHTQRPSRVDSKRLTSVLGVGIEPTRDCSQRILSPPIGITRTNTGHAKEQPSATTATRYGALNAESPRISGASFCASVRTRTATVKQHSCQEVECTALMAEFRCSRRRCKAVGHSTGGAASLQRNGETVSLIGCQWAP